MYKEVVHQTQEVLDESLNEEHRLLKMRARPKILVADTYESALELVERYRPYLFGVVSDTRFPCGGELSADAGVRFLSRIKEEIPDLPLLLISNESDNRLKAEEIKVQFLDKNSPNLFDELHHYFLDFLGFGDFVFRYPDGTEVARASNLRELEKVLATIPEEPLVLSRLPQPFFQLDHGPLRNCPGVPAAHGADVRFPGCRRRAAISGG
jgi:hypothetical protein